MLSVKQGGIKYHFLSLWYDSTWDWTLVSRAIKYGLIVKNISISSYSVYLNNSVYHKYVVSSI